MAATSLPPSPGLPAAGPGASGSLEMTLLDGMISDDAVYRSSSSILDCDGVVSLVDAVDNFYSELGHIHDHGMTLDSAWHREDLDEGLGSRCDRGYASGHDHAHVDYDDHVGYDGNVDFVDHIHGSDHDHFEYNDHVDYDDRVDYHDLPGIGDQLDSTGSQDIGDQLMTHNCLDIGDQKKFSDLQDIEGTFYAAETKVYIAHTSVTGASITTFAASQSIASPTCAPQTPQTSASPSPTPTTAPTPALTPAPMTAMLKTPSWTSRARLLRSEVIPLH
ncbi:unnamed protein product [Prorocentrum cordatum]|uniref:Uncharacterized protein n=1 Tax=Prorocentrum cordatum TaxID=2364126 RepID=A0ABN9SZC9_9DINO|nr:unnamed protein product [Polarella glacialis]